MTTIPPETPETPPESNPHTKQVRSYMKAIREVVRQIPELTHPPKGARVRLTFASAAKDAFLEAVAVAIEASDHLGTSSPVTARELRDEIAFGRAHGPLAADLGVQRLAVLYTMELRRSKIVRRALHAYSIAKSLNRKGDTVLVPHLEMIKKALGAGRPSTRPAEEPTSEPPADGGES
jgi:hypothetical protein